MYIFLRAKNGISNAINNVVTRMLDYLKSQNQRFMEIFLHSTGSFRAASFDYSINSSLALRQTAQII